MSEGGQVRHLSNPSGETIVERLEAYDNAPRRYSCSIIAAPFPARDYRSTLQVDAIAGSERARVTWSGQFTPAGVSEEEVTALFQGIYAAGLDAVRDGCLSR